jgi:hypothetical protein
LYAPDQGERKKVNEVRWPLACVQLEPTDPANHPQTENWGAKYWGPVDTGSPSPKDPDLQLNRGSGARLPHLGARQRRCNSRPPGGIELHGARTIADDACPFSMELQLEPGILSDGFS